MNARVFVGGRRVDALPPDDRGLAYGDGLFETMRMCRGVVPWWDAHWARLSLGATRLRMPLPDAQQVCEEAAGLIGRDDDIGDGVLKLIVTRGSGKRGYAPPAQTSPTWVLSRHALPAPAPLRGLHVCWCTTRLASQPLLAGCKHCNRLEQVLAAAECVQAGVEEGLMCDYEDNVVSAIGANLFLFRGGRWMTPALDRCGVAGICRDALMPGLRPLETRLDRAAVETADAIFLCNAVRGILSVARIGGCRWPPHPEVEEARRLLAELHPGFAQEYDQDA